MEEKIAKLEAELKTLTSEDEILDKKLEINALRHEHNIADKNQMVYKEFVQ